MLNGKEIPLRGVDSLALDSLANSCGDIQKSFGSVLRLTVFLAAHKAEDAYDREDKKNGVH